MKKLSIIRLTSHNSKYIGVKVSDKTPLQSFNNETFVKLLWIFPAYAEYLPISWAFKAKKKLYVPETNDKEKESFPYIHREAWTAYGICISLPFISGLTERISRETIYYKFIPGKLIWHTKNLFI